MAGAERRGAEAMVAAAVVSLREEGEAETEGKEMGEGRKG
jgi:hypothetical protein